MGKFKARNLSRQDIALLVKAIKRRNNEFLALLTGPNGTTAKALLHGCQIIEARAKEILTEKGHIVTGNLRRSINSRVFEREEKIVGEVGTFVHYAPFVEALPDGGYLFPASEEKFSEVTGVLAREGLAVAIRNWGR